MLPKIPDGWRRRLALRSFLVVGGRALVRVSCDLAQSAYGGEFRSEFECWGVQTVDGEHDLFNELREALATLPLDTLRAVVAAAPLAFAEVLAIEYGFIRISVVGPGRLVETVLRESGHADCISSPLFRDDVVSFQCYQPGDSPGAPGALWSLRARVDGTLLSKELVLTVPA
ncbi:MAG: hypothetical protein V4850_34740 [Myxococcota bacterium]